VNVKTIRIALIVFTGFVLSVVLPPLYAQQEKAPKGPAVDKIAAQLVGTWEIFQTKEPTKPYRASFRGHPFVNRGPNAFTLLVEYKSDGTFRRISRIGPHETIEEGTWKISGNELRQSRKGATDQEVLYVRFDNPNQYTSVEVYEDTPDPGLFAQFKRVP
jgi:hypothetical protein